jgi:catalase
VIRSQYRNPQNFLLDHNSLFDLLANTPEGYEEAEIVLNGENTDIIKQSCGDDVLQ